MVAGPRAHLNMFPMENTLFGVFICLLFGSLLFT